MSGRIPNPPGQAAHIAPPVDAEKRTSGASFVATAGAAVEHRREAGDPVELEPECEQQRLARDRGAGRRARLERLEEAAERLERLRRGLALGEQPRDGLGTRDADREPCGILAHPPVALDDVGTGDGAELAAAEVHLQVDAGQRLEASAEARAGASHALGDQPDAAALARVDVQHAVGLAEAQRAQDHALHLSRPAHRSGR